MKKISVSLLVFNENHNLEKTITKAYETLEQSSFNYELWVFDNNSNDGTDSLVKSLLKKFNNLKYFRQKENLGYAGNFYSALKVPVADYKCVVDGDGQYGIENIVECVHALDQGYDILIGIRKPRKDPRIRIFMSLILKILSRILLGSQLSDINAGFRCMTADAANQIDIKYRYNFVNPEIFSLSIIKKLKICEKIIKHYPREGGRSELSGIKNIIFNSLRMVKYMIDLKNEIKKSQTN
jgi:glycosyltransferase involved in cell wall biosynthesis